MVRFSTILTALLLSTACLVAQTEYVDPFIGTGGHGHTFPGAVVPFGMVQLSPDTGTEGWDWCSGYHYSDSTIIGFSHTHLSGTGIGDYGDILLMPFSGKLKWQAGTKTEPDAGYRSRFRHETEKAEPGYYRVHLDDHNIDVELTAADRAGMHRYKYGAKQDRQLLIDLRHGISDTADSAYLHIIDSKRIEGLRRSRGWARSQWVYFAIETSVPFNVTAARLDEEQLSSGKEFRGKQLAVALRFNATDENDVMIKTAISAVDEQGAWKNLRSSIPSWAFDQVKKQAAKKWQTALSAIEVEGGTVAQKRTFYTALYHSMIHPSLFQDADGRYRGMDQKIHTADGFTNYTIFSLWDTFRALHPLLNILEPERTTDFINTLIAKYKEGGILPIWELAANYTGTMIGYHAIPVITDAWVKGIRGFDRELARVAMSYSATRKGRGLKSYMKWGFVAADESKDAVSRTLEYAYDDWCIGVFSQNIGNEAAAKRFFRRATYYKNVFDQESGLSRGRFSNGSWRTPFDPADLSGWGGGDFTEGNSWQYSWFVPQDVRGFIDLMGGDEKFTAKLDELFSTRPAPQHVLPDVTGLIGQYAHGNEPSHHTAYLYNFAGQPWKTQKLVRQIMDEFYSDRPDGLIGNEDCGQMSAWYVFSAMGFYPVTPGTDQYVIGSPLFDKVIIHLPNGKDFTIIAANNSKHNRYIQSARVNGESHLNSWIPHALIMSGENLKLEMGPQPNRDWGSDKANRPFAGIPEKFREDFKPVFAPYIASGATVFGAATTLTLAHIDPHAELRYSLDGAEPDKKSTLYKHPLKIEQSIVLKAKAFFPDGSSSPRLAKQIRKTFRPSSEKQIKLGSKYADKYAANGPMTLFDGQRGSIHFTDGKWLGFQGDDFEVTVDLEKLQSIKKVTIGFLSDQEVWIFKPLEVRVAFSEDGKTFKSAGKLRKPLIRYDAIGLHEYSFKTQGKMAQFVRIRAKNISRNPEWHKGAGGRSWLFVDEVMIEK